MSLKSNRWVAGAAMCLAAMCLAIGAAGAQGVVYKCGPRSYSQYPCSKRIVDTDDAPVPRKAAKARDADARRMEENRLLARTMRRKPDETAEEFQTRRRRARLLQTDRDECERLDTRMPVEQARLKNADRGEVLEAEGALAQGRKRFRELRC